MEEMHYEEPYHQLETQIVKFIRGERSEDFASLLKKVYDFQREANPVYARFCSSYPGFVDWREIPAVPQQVFKQTALRCFPPEKTTRTFHTSGTTGEGFGQHHFLNMHLYETAVREGWKHAKLPAPVQIFLIPQASASPHSSLSQMTEWLADASSVWLMQEGRLISSRLPLPLDRPVAVFGTALAFLNAMEQTKEERLVLPKESVLIETGGYKGSGREIPRRELHRQMKAFFQAREIFTEYGMTEISSQFYAGEDGIYRNPPWAKAVVIDPATSLPVADGETGIIKILDLANLGSVCAVLTQDLAVRRGEDFELLGRDPMALPRGCSRSADEILRARPKKIKKS